MPEGWQMVVGDGARLVVKGDGVHADRPRSVELRMRMSHEGGLIGQQPELPQCRLVDTRIRLLDS